MQENCYTSATSAVELMNCNLRLESIARRCDVGPAPLLNLSNKSMLLPHPLGPTSRVFVRLDKGGSQASRLTTMSK